MSTDVLRLGHLPPSRVCYVFQLIVNAMYGELMFFKNIFITEPLQTSS